MAITSRLWPEAPLATGSCPCRGRPASVAACGPSSRPLGSRAPLWGAGMGKACLEQVSIGLMQMFQAKLKVSGSLSSRNSFPRKRKMEPLVWSCTKEQGGVDRPVLWPLPFLSAGLRPWGGESPARRLGCTVTRRLASRPRSSCHHPVVREVTRRFLSRTELSCPDPRLRNQVVPLCHMKSPDHR